jgi:hypothetical protein
MWDKHFRCSAFTKYHSSETNQEYHIDTGNYIMDRYDIKSNTNYKQALEEENALIQKSKKQT